VKAISGRLRRLETRMGLVETEENRRARRQLELLQHRIAARDAGQSSVFAGKTRESGRNRFNRKT
jgi:hypothetical protein